MLLNYIISIIQSSLNKHQK